MDFSLTDDLQAAVDLADRVLREHGDPARLRGVERADGLDREAWRALADTGLLAVAWPEAHGGAGLGWLAAHLLCEAAGRHAALVPLGETLVAGEVLAGAADPTGLLPSLADGSAICTLALQDAGAAPWETVTTASRDGDEATVTGTKVVVPWAPLADHLLVTATDPADGRACVVLVARGDVTVRAQQLSSSVPHGLVELEAAPGVVVGDDVAAVRLLDLATSSLTSLQAGMLDAAVHLAADHTSTREQFGRPIATFQAVSQRVASAFIDAECARLTALQAAWRLHEGLPATDEVAIAKWWAAEAGHRVLHAAQHVHGGIGVDREYPLHRYLLRTKQVEFALGSAADQLGRLGASLAADPA